MTRDEVVERISTWTERGRPHVEPRSEHPSAMTGGERVLCPSQAPEEGTLVIGVIRDDGSIARTSEPRPVPVDLTNAQQARLRLAGPCRRTGCDYWAGSCQLAGAIVVRGGVDGDLPPCHIRNRCRWSIEQGAAACSVCDVVNYWM